MKPGESTAPPSSRSVAGATKSVVLFVDDETNLLDGIRNALRKHPYTILIADSAAKGLEVLASQHVDVVVSDERMPGMSGSEFLAIVRQKYPNTIRIILTGQASLDAAIRAINEGEIYRFLTKPRSPMELAHTIKDALLLKTLTRESHRLLGAAKQQRTILERLEQAHPGITQVLRTSDGSIILDADDDDDVAHLIDEMRGEVARSR